jgi:hypothetical protein
MILKNGELRGELFPNWWMMAKKAKTMKRAKKKKKEQRGVW